MDETALAALVSQALAELGSTSDEVADNLRRAGITGLRDDACGCPVARYLASKVTELRTPTGLFAWEVYRRGVSMPAGDVWLDVPASVAGFIRLFDLHEAFDDLADVTP